MTMDEKAKEAFDEVLGDIEEVTSKLEALRDMVSCAACAEDVKTLLANLDEAEQEAVGLAGDLRDCLRAARKIKGAS